MSKIKIAVFYMVDMAYELLSVSDLNKNVLC